MPYMTGLTDEVEKDFTLVPMPLRSIFPYVSHIGYLCFTPKGLKCLPIVSHKAIYVLHQRG